MKKEKGVNINDTKTNELDKVCTVLMCILEFETKIRGKNEEDYYMVTLIYVQPGY